MRVPGFAERRVVTSTGGSGIHCLHLVFASVLKAVGGIRIPVDRLRGMLSGGVVFSNSSVRNFMHVRRDSVCLCPSFGA